ncbi:MAG: ATP-dependent helicase HrpB, partial [Pseudomonadales bacterium]|nr:ATP-dependent helicase HrpB [Pseudomonadales bacterium]
MTELPITAVIPELIRALAETDAVVLEAPPGAGKTTAVPLALLDQPWLQGQKILLLEPRRIAAKSAALRLSHNIGQSVGQRVGYRMRMQSKISAATQLEVITEGILTRMLQRDPSLEGVGLIIFDEFHERSLNNDLNLALVLEGRTLFRDERPLKLLLMSATLNGDAIAKLLNNAPIIKSAGRSFPVDILYSSLTTRPNQQQPRLENRIVSLIGQALREQSGSLLVFLPGQREIHKVRELLQQSLDLQHQCIDITPLYGNLPLKEQQQAIDPVAKDRRKIVLATNIAETSITIDGITTVIDSGLCRRAHFDGKTGTSHLSTQKISQASSIQRAGRAGRTAPGVCYRLWTKEQQQSLAPFETPEILSADLCHLLLNLLLWGNDNVDDLQWLNPPRRGQIQQATDLLIKLGAIVASENTTLTPLGEKICLLPMPPRLAHLCLNAQALGMTELGCNLAALLAENDPLQTRQADISLRLQALREPGKHNSYQWQHIRQLSRTYQKLLHSDEVSATVPSDLSELSEQDKIALLVATAWPERIAQRRDSNSSEYKLANGRAAKLSAADYLQQQPYLAVAHCGGREGMQTDQIQLASPLQPKMFSLALKSLTSVQQSLSWDEKAERIRAEQHYCLGELILERGQSNAVDLNQKRALILQLIARRGLQLLPWNRQLQQFCDRVNFLHNNSHSETWPDLSQQALTVGLEQWLGPFLSDQFVSN